MPQNSTNIYGHELIGLTASIESKFYHNSSVIHGVIIDETKNMFTIMHKTGTMKIPKNEMKLDITLPNKHTVSLDGKRLINRPEDRTKTFRRTQRLAT